MTVKNQHHVPKFYLNHFAFNSGHIWVYDKTKQNCFTSPTEKVACGRYFYDNQRIDEKDNKEQYLENYYSNFESKFAPIYAKFLIDISKSDSYEIAQSIKSDLANYLVIQIDRSIEHREESHQLTIEIYNQLKDKGFSDVQLIELGFGNEIFDKKELHIDSIVAGNEMRATLSEILQEHIWLIFKNLTNQSFYTSDCPVVRKSHLSNEYVSEDGYASPGIEIAFPLNPYYILVLCDREYFFKNELFDGTLCKMDSIENVEYYNSLQVISSYRQVFSSERSFGLIEQMLKETPSAFDLNRKRIG